MNWDDARVFLAVEREKTLRGAARTLNLDQATVGRRIAALEHALRATLFLRTSEGYALTAAGEAALKSAEKMEHSAHELVRRTQGMDTRVCGGRKGHQHRLDRARIPASRDRTPACCAPRSAHPAGHVDAHAQSCKA